MFSKSIVFVIGAGASYEYGLPLGGTLKAEIAQKVRFRFQHGSLIGGDHDLLDHIRRRVPDQERRNVYTRASNVLAAAIGSFISIDEALHYVGATPEAVEVGKIAIIGQILEAERNSTLAISKETGRLDVDRADGKWLSQLLSMALSRIQRSQLRTAFDHVTFINFNYDRCIEHYLYWALQERASATADEAKEIVQNLNMIRPYGSIGALSFNSTDQHAFGTTAQFDPFTRIDAMRTYTEQRPLHDVQAVEGVLADARMIIFLGFGFHATNIDLLQTGSRKSGAAVLGTIKGIHRENHDVIRARIKTNLRLVGDTVSLLDMTASELLRELRQRILISVE
ncbi:hypothetical protein [Bradyrhizobium sp. WSM1743]|uniref:hypothetical protein n=1 Tax=Bradyrhizobium sp. WSM1743 TaxID=318996 RepID=UPI000481F15D|nr:hypothetical protein [Bradyrhizobium sp. WSM1743]